MMLDSLMRNISRIHPVERERERIRKSGAAEACY
jgi:hypothetical protein